MKIVDDATRRPARDRVEGGAVGESRDVVRHQPLHGVAGAGTPEMDLARVANIEDTNGRSRGSVLVDDAAGVRNENGPAAEVDQFGSQASVRLVEGRAFGWTPFTGR